MKARSIWLAAIVASLTPTLSLAQSTPADNQAPQGHAVTVPLRPQAQPSATDKALAKPTILNPTEPAKKEGSGETRRWTDPSPSGASAGASPDQGKSSPVASTPVAPVQAEPTAAKTSADPASSSEPVASAEAEPPKPKPVTLHVRVNLSKQNVAVTVDGKPTYTWLISSGTAGYETPTGTFKPQWMARRWYSKKYDDAPMPHSIFFNGGIAFHGTQSVRLLGNAASHGCIRLAPANAQTLFGLVQKHSMAGTRIVVEGRANVGVASKRERLDNQRLRRTYASEPRYGGRGGYTYAPSYPPGYYARPQQVWPGDSPWAWGGARPQYRGAAGYGRRYY